MSFLSQLDTTPPDEQFPLIRNWMKNSPKEFFRELRAQRPILVTPECTLFALYEDVSEILHNPRVFTVKLYEPKMGTYLMAQDDTPVHYREKSIMQSMLNRDDLPRIRELVGTWTKEYLESAENNQIDAVNGLTRRVPMTLVQKYMGFDTATEEQIAEWSLWNQWNTFHNQPFDGNANHDEIHNKMLKVNEAMGEYLKQLVGQKIAAIKSGAISDDIVSRLLQTAYPEQVGFPMERLVRNIGGLLIGTIETTSQATAQALQVLLRLPEQVLEKAKLAAQADDPTVFDGYVFEALRHDPISPYLFRQSGSDYTLAKNSARAIEIKSGTIVLPLVLSAMFDPARFPDADSFNPTRPLDNSFHFGMGLHECMGKYIGLVMIPEIIRQILRQPNIRAESAIQFNNTPFPDQYEIAWG